MTDEDKLNDPVFNDLIWPEGSDDDDSALQEALLIRVAGDSGPLQELVDSRVLTREEWERLGKLRHVWPAVALGPLYRKSGPSTGVHIPIPIKIIPAHAHPIVRQLVEWVRAERKTRCDWLQKNKLKKGELDKLLDRAYVRYPYPFSERQKVFIRRLVDQPKRFP
jgi:hypothetical protein